MRRFLHRALFFTGIAIFYGYIFIDVFISPIEKLLDTNIASVLYGIFGLFTFYFVACFFYVLYKLIVGKHKKKLFWLLIIIFVPFIGVFVYYEKHVFNIAPEIKTPTPEKLVALLSKETQEEDHIARLVWRRFAAFLIDYGAFVLFYSNYIYFVSVKTDSGLHIEGMQHLILILLVWFLWLPWLESRNGQTVGKRLLRIMVVNSNGEKPELGESFRRHIVDLVDVFFFSFAWFLLRRPNSIPRRLGDFFAKTWVLSKSQ
jgi:uncharacterized RDD family membrane protein YckC